MKIDILLSLQNFPYFTTEAVKQLAGDEGAAPGTIRTALYRWMKTGQVIQLKKGVYMTRRFFEVHGSDVDFAPAFSTILLPQSYVSLEFALQRAGVLTDVTYPISAVTWKQTRVFTNPLGTFSYRSIKKNLYLGYTISDYLGIPFAIATPAKALFDTLYLRPITSIGLGKNENLAEELRLNLEDFPEKDQLEFGEFVEMSQSRKMEQVLINLRRTVWRPSHN